MFDKPTAQYLERPERGREAINGEDYLRSWKSNFKFEISNHTDEENIHEIGAF